MKMLKIFVNIEKCSKFKPVPQLEIKGPRCESNFGAPILNFCLTKLHSIKRAIRGGL